MTTTAEIWNSLRIKYNGLIQQHKDQFDQLNRSLALLSCAKGFTEDGSIILNDNLVHKDTQYKILEEIDNYRKSYNSVNAELTIIKKSIDQNNVKHEHH